jgi:hypothetical protein
MSNVVTSTSATKQPATVVLPALPRIPSRKFYRQ